MVTSRDDRLLADVEFLASDNCDGRAPGTSGGRLARQYVVDKFAELGLEASGEDGYLHKIAPIGGANVLGTIRGRTQPDRFVLLGAHYDHLGSWGGEIFRGADDNASGVAVMLEVARTLAADPTALGRSVLLCAFDAEEPPNFLTPTMGSIAWVEDPTVPLERIDLMLCLDIVGRRLGGEELPDAIGDSVFALGGERSGAGAILDSNSQHRDLQIRRADADLVPPLSDHFAFEMAEVPFVFFTCGRSWRYHTPDDTPDHLDYRKMAGLVDVLADVITEASHSDIGPYRPGARSDAATIGSLRQMLEALVEVDPEAEIALDQLDFAQAEMTEEGMLPDEIHSEVGALLLALEEAIEAPR